MKLYFSDEVNDKKSIQGNRGKHQLLLTSINNKVIMLHFCPATGDIFIHELDPNANFRYTQPIKVPATDLI